MLPLHASPYCKTSILEYPNLAHVCLHYRRSPRSQAGISLPQPDSAAVAAEPLATGKGHTIPMAASEPKAISNSATAGAQAAIFGIQEATAGMPEASRVEEGSETVIAELLSAEAREGTQGAGGDRGVLQGLSQGPTCSPLVGDVSL